MKKHHLSVYKIPAGTLSGGKKTLAESDASQEADLKWFAEYKDMYSEELQTLPDFDPNENIEKLGLYFRTVFPPEMQRRIRVVGRGMEKVAFVTDSGVCFKFQYHVRFGEQMRNEIIESRRHPDLMCFPRLFDYSSDGMCLACETAEPPDEAAFKRVFGGLSVTELNSKIDAYAAGRMDDRGRDALLRDLNPEQRRALADLFEFSKEIYGKTGHALKDIDSYRNWGRTFRNGYETIIVTDYGL